MSSRRAAVTALLLLIACESPAAPRPRDLRVPGRNADLAVVRTKSNVVFETDASMDNGCNGDVVTLQGKAHQVFTVLDAGDSLYITVHTNFDDLKGYGVPSGARYHLNNAETERDVVGVIPTFTFDATIHFSLELVSEGSEPNLIWDLTEITRIDDNGSTETVTDVKNSLSCRG